MLGGKNNIHTYIYVCVCVCVCNLKIIQLIRMDLLLRELMSKNKTRWWHIDAGSIKTKILNEVGSNAPSKS